MTLRRAVPQPMTKVPRNQARTRDIHAVTVCVDASLHGVNAPTTIGRQR